MPAIGGTDPADLVARARAELGFSRQLEQPRRVAPPPRFEEGKAIVIGGIVIAGGGYKEERSKAIPATAVGAREVAKEARAMGGTTTTTTSVARSLLPVAVRKRSTTAIIVATGKEGEGTKRTRRTDH
jgi:hypothetical protein